MEKGVSAKTNQKEVKEKKPILESDLLVVGLVLLNLGLIALDFYTHPHQGVADLERRMLLREAIGDLARHIGNYGFSSCLAMGAVFAKHAVDSITNSQEFKEITKFGFKIFLGAIITLNAAIEFFPKNPELIGDFSAGLSGVFLGVVSLELLINKIKAQRKRRKIQNDKALL